MSKKKESRYKRWLIDEPTREVLDSVWCKTDLPTAEELSSLACILDVKPRKVQVWFQNKRQRKEPREEVGEEGHGERKKEPEKPPHHVTQLARPLPLAPQLVQPLHLPPPFLQLIPYHLMHIPVDNEDDLPEIVRVCKNNVP